MRKPQLTLLLLLCAVTSWSQNFTFTPQNPKPGDLVTFTYEPAGMLVGATKPIECSYYQLNKTAPNAFGTSSADDLKLSRKGNKYTGSLKVDTAANFIYLGFYSGNNFDHNKNEGYYIIVQDGEKARRGAYYSQYAYYNFLGRQVGLERNTDKALEALQKEIDLYPEDRKDYLTSYVSLAVRSPKVQASALVQKEIESMLKSGLRTEEDYSSLATLYSIAKLPEQAKFMEELKKQKFPNGYWTVDEFMGKLYREQDPEVLKAMVKEAEHKVMTDTAWKNVKDNLPYQKIRVLTLYKNKKNWDKLKQSIQEINPVMNEMVSGMYNDMAWSMQGKNENIQLAEELSRKATEYAKKEMLQPTEKKPSRFTTKEWERSRHSRYGMYADTYAMVLYRMGAYKKGFAYAKEAAMDMNDGKDANLNTTYALLAEKALPLKQYKAQLENFVRKGSSGKEVKEVLQRTYVQEKGSEEGFSSYMGALEKEERERKLEELRKSMLNTEAPVFTLLDLEGKQVALADLKGKTVVVDFWATWCGPCISSFPGMQKMITKYKNNPDVVFLFVDTWESVEDKKKNAADFITGRKLDFHVLLDVDNVVVEKFKVEGIPTKFVIDKNGKIRFKSVGYEGDGDQLVEELTTMIEMSNDSEKKEL